MTRLRLVGRLRDRARVRRQRRRAEIRWVPVRKPRKKGRFFGFLEVLCDLFGGDS